MTERVHVRSRAAGVRDSSGVVRGCSGAQVLGQAKRYVEGFVLLVEQPQDSGVWLGGVQRRNEETEVALEQEVWGQEVGVRRHGRRALR